MNSKLLSIIAVLIGILLPMKGFAQTTIYAPEFSFEGDNIIMTCETQGANIYYVMAEFANEDEAYSLMDNLDVSEANSMRTLYTQPFPVTSNVVIKAVAKMPQQQGESEVTTLIYSYTAWSHLLAAIEYGSNVQERAKDSPLVSDDLKEHLQWALEEGEMIYQYRGQMPDSHEAEHFAEEIEEIAHEIDEILNQQPAGPEPYAVLSQNNTVLTFYYDTNRGAFQGSMDVTSTAWLDFKEQITTAVFDASFADCTTLTSTSSWFADCKKLTIIEGIENLNTQNVTDMGGMFLGCDALTSLDVSHFNTENVTDMSYMFSVCSLLTTIDVSHFNTSKVTNMAAMFGHCSSLTSLDLSNFNTENVTNMLHMFNDCHTLTTLDLSSFNTANVTSMIGMFFGCAGLKTIYVSDSWSTSNVSEGIEVFYECNNLVGGRGTKFSHEHIDYTYAHIDGGTANPGYFTAAGAEPWTDPVISEVVLTGKIDNFWYDETGNNPNGEEAVIFTIPETPDEGNSWDVNVLSTFVNNQLTFTTPDGEALNNITGQIIFETRGNMVALDDGRVLMYEGENEQEEIAFAEPGMGMIRIYNSDITQRLLHEPNAKYMALPVSVRAYLNNEEVTVTNGSFTVLVQIPQQAQEPEPYAVLSDNNTVLTFYYDDQKVARGGIDINKNYIQDGQLSPYSTATTATFDASFANYKPTSTSCWFMKCSSLTSITGTVNLNTEDVKYMSEMFSGCSSLTSLDLSGFKTGNAVYLDNMFSGCSNLTNLDLSGFNTDNVTDMGDMFIGCSSLTSLDLSTFNTENVTRMSAMFAGCSSLTSLDLSTFNTEKVTEMGGMFSNCSSLKSLDLSGFRPRNVTQIQSMFSGCSSLTNIDLRNFSTDNATNMNAMFAYCSALTNLDLSSLKTDNVSDMSLMFYGCSSLTDLDLRGFNTEKTYSMESMFSGCSNLTNLNMSGFNTNNVTNMMYMFSGCSSLTSLDLSDFNTEKVTEMSQMFILCKNLTTIYVGEGWNTANVTEGSYIFLDCTSLVGGAGTHYNANHTDYTYAHIDGGTANPGYFTASGAEPWTDEDLKLYAVLSRNNTVITFYYDDKMEARGGISVDDESWERREQELISSIVALVFDESFSDFVVNDSEGFSINLDGWTSLAAVKAGSINIPAEEYVKTGNPNLLVYVNEPSLAPQGVQNVVVNGVAQEIVLTNATEGNNNWHCPEPFRAEKITYTRNFSQQTEIGISRGWESIALPFTVQDITHESKGRIIPFGAQGTGKYFWLRGYSPDGLHRATVLEANTPYVISMPNNPAVYPYEYNLNGRVTFSAENTTVPATPETWEMTITRDNIRMAPVFQLIPRNEMAYAINVGQPLDRYAEGSVFTRELREVRPFEAVTYHEPVNGARPKNIRIAPQSDDDITGIRTIELDETEGTWYSIDGRQLQGQPHRKGVYLQKGKKIVVK